MTDKYAVIGNPINHSKSPILHRLFAKQTDQDIEYTAIEVAVDDFTNRLMQLRDVDKLKAINVTVPFKEQAWQIVDDKSDRAQLAGAVNNIIFDDDGRLFGDNTDGIGLCRDLKENHQIDIKNKRILLLGAGGAAHGALGPLLKSQPSQLFIANRTASKAVDLAKLFADFGPVDGGGFDDVQGPYDLIINATTASLQGEVPAISSQALNAQTACYDMMYNNTDTAFVSWSKRHHAAKSIDGLGMLVEQAAETFRLWRGIKPETQSVIRQLRNIS